METVAKSLTPQCSAVIARLAQLRKYIQSARCAPEGIVAKVNVRVVVSRENGQGHGGLHMNKGRRKAFLRPRFPLLTVIF